MKIIKYFVIALVGMALAMSCDRMLVPENTSKVKVEINVAGYEQEAPATKAVKKAWAEGDKINIWFEDAYWKVLPQLVLTRTAAGWSASDVDEALLSASGTFKAAYEGTNSLFNTTTDYIQKDFPTDGTSFTLAEWSSSASCTKVPVCCYANDVAYTYDKETKTLSASIDSWVLKTQLQFVVTGLDTTTPDRYAMTCDAKTVRVQGFTVYGTEPDNKIDIGSAYTTICNGLTGRIWTNGDFNEDGIVFRFGRRTDNYTPNWIDVFLVDKQKKKVYNFKKEDISFSCSPTKCHGIKVAFSKFTDITSEHPFAE